MNVKWYITFKKDLRIKELHFLTLSSVICPTKWTNTRKYIQNIETISNLPPETDELTLKKLITSCDFQIKAMVFNCTGLKSGILSFGKTIGIYTKGLSIDFIYHSGFVLNYGWKDLRYSKIKPLTERHCKRLFLGFYNYQCISPHHYLDPNYVEFNEALPQLMKKEYFDFYVEKCSNWGEIVDSGEFTC